jgi:hypothetical protein
LNDREYLARQLYEFIGCTDWRNLCVSFVSAIQDQSNGIWVTQKQAGGSPAAQFQTNQGSIYQSQTGPSSILQLESNNVGIDQEQTVEGEAKKYYIVKRDNKQGGSKFYSFTQNIFLFLSRREWVIS